MTDDLGLVNVPGRGPTFESELQAEAAAGAQRFGLEPEKALAILRSGGSLPQAAAFKDARSITAMEEARRRLAAWEESERQRKAREAGLG